MFEIEKTTSFNSDKLVEGNEYDYVTRTSSNQGILKSTGFVNKENLNPSGNWSLGLLQMDFFHRGKEWYAGQFVRKITPRFEINSHVQPFFTTILNSLKPVLQSVLVRNVDDTFSNTIVVLPTKNGQIDFDFIEGFVAELEAQRVAELEAYLSVTGLKDYELTHEEKKVLDGFKNIEWSTYQINELFEVKSYKKRFDANKVTILENGNYPYIVRTAYNNGRRGYINEDEKYLNPENTISFGQDTATMWYQEAPYFTGDKIKILEARFEGFKKENAHFFITSMAKPFTKFSWGASSFSEKVIKSQEFLLPVNKNDQIDFAYMENLTQAIKKLIIKDVVTYADEKVESTKAVLSKRNKG